MSSLEEVGHAIREALEKVTQLLSALRTAEEHAEGARDLLRTAGEGSSDPEWEQAVGAFDSAAGGINELVGFAQAAEASAGGYLKSLGVSEGTAPVPPAPSSEQAPPRRVPPSGSKEHVDQLRGELPPPVRPGTGQKTHGRWFAQGTVNQVSPIVSGNDALSEKVVEQLRANGVRDIPVTVTHVEMKLAAHMTSEGISAATVVINNYPCKGPAGCDTLVPRMLPDGSSLTVHGVTRQGTIMRKTYTGGAPWS